jgi:hypothetical protein
VTGEAVVVDAVDHTAELGGSLGGVASFGRDHQGELYIATFAGRILKIVPDASLLPVAPRGLTYSGIGRRVTLAWSAPATGLPPTGYRLEVGSAPGATEFVAPIGLQTALDAEGVPDGRYYVRVRAERDGAVGPASNEVMLDVPMPCMAPGVPNGLTHAVSGSTVTLAWGASAGAAGYSVEVGSSTGLANLGVFPVGVVTNLSAPAPAGRYFVRLRAANACGMSAPSNEVDITVP